MTTATISTRSQLGQGYRENPYALTLGGMIHSEWIKAFSLRSIRWSIGISALLGAALSLLMTFAVQQMVGPGTAGSEMINAITSFPANFLCLVFAVLGVFIFSSEYSSGMILSTLTAAPARGPLLLAKALVTTFISGAAAVVNVIISALIAVVMIPSLRPSLFSAQTLTGMLGTVLFLIAVALFSFAVAGILRSTAGGITVAVAVIFVAPIVFSILMSTTSWTWVPAVANYLPTSLGEIAGYGAAPAGAAMLAETVAEGAPRYGQSLFGLGLWAVLPLVASAVLFSRRDAK